MKRFILGVAVLILVTLLAGCGTQPVKPPVVVEEKQEVKVDPRLLQRCEKPAPMTAMDQGHLLTFSMKEASKLIVCGQHVDVLINVMCKAFNCDATVPAP